MAQQFGRKIYKTCASFAVSTEFATGRLPQWTGPKVGANQPSIPAGHPNDGHTNSDNRRIAAFNSPIGVTLGVCKA
jgi:hypothetical protein